jgi:hypothetical protein
MTNWDIFINEDAYAKTSIALLGFTSSQANFKCPTEGSYHRFRELCQLIDICKLDYGALIFQQRILVAASMYIILCLHIGNMSVYRMVNDVKAHSGFLYEESGFNELFSVFLKQWFGFEKDDILPAIQYICGYVKVQLSSCEKGLRTCNYEEFLSYQCYNRGILEFLKTN